MNRFAMDRRAILKMALKTGGIALGAGAGLGGLRASGLGNLEKQGAKLFDSLEYGSRAKSEKQEKESPEAPEYPEHPESYETLKASLPNLAQNAKPIGVSERRRRLEKARSLMEASRLEAILLEPGASMEYFTGLKWHRSERVTALIIPRKGAPFAITPFFEEPSVRESLGADFDIRPWHEHEDPFQKLAMAAKDHGLQGKGLGLEPSVRYFVQEGVQKSGVFSEVVSAYPVTAGCRMIKSYAELCLMHKAAEVTLTAFRHIMSVVKLGDGADDIAARMTGLMGALGGHNPWALVLIDQASAFPHGSGQVQILKEGSLLLMDCGCAVQGYQADISRSFVFGTASAAQRLRWQQVREGQELVFEQARVGVEAGHVDEAVRHFYEKLGYGPGYAMPGLPHRTGHGIGMEGHEPVNFVQGEKTRLAAGMCFSNEPGLYDFANFGVRLEDCLYIGAKKAHWFTKSGATIDEPLGELVPLIKEKAIGYDND